MALNTVKMFNWFVYKWPTKKCNEMMAQQRKYVELVCLQMANLKV